MDIPGPWLAWAALERPSAKYTIAAPPAPSFRPTSCFWKISIIFNLSHLKCRNRPCFFLCFDSMHLPLMSQTVNWSTATWFLYLTKIGNVRKTYLHKAAAEVSKDKEPIGRECAEFNWLESQLMSDSNELRFKWVGCQLIWDSSGLDVKWFEVQVMWLSTDVWFKWFCQTKLFCETSFKNEALKIKNEAFCETSFKIEALKLKNEAFLRDFLQKWSFETQNRSFCARLPSKTKLWSSKTKLLCETSFKKESLKIKNEAFLRDFL